MFQRGNVIFMGVCKIIVKGMHCCYARRLSENHRTLVSVCRNEHCNHL